MGHDRPGVHHAGNRPHTRSLADRVPLDVTDGPVKVYFEDARQRKWLPKDTSSSEYRGHLMGAGSVKRDSVIWQDALTDWGIPFEMVPPRAGATKWDADTFARITGYKGRTSNHARDAALLVFGRK